MSRRVKTAITVFYLMGVFPSAWVLAICLGKTYALVPIVGATVWLLRKALFPRKQRPPPVKLVRAHLLDMADGHNADHPRQPVALRILIDDGENMESEMLAGNVERDAEGSEGLLTKRKRRSRVVVSEAGNTLLESGRKP